MGTGYEDAIDEHAVEILGQKHLYLFVLVRDGVLSDFLAVVRGPVGRGRDANGREKGREDRFDFCSVGLGGAG